VTTSKSIEVSSATSNTSAQPTTKENAANTSTKQSPMARSNSNRIVAGVIAFLVLLAVVVILQTAHKSSNTSSSQSGSTSTGNSSSSTTSSTSSSSTTKVSPAPTSTQTTKKTDTTSTSQSTKTETSNSTVSTSANQTPQGIVAHYTAKGATIFWNSPADATNLTNYNVEFAKSGGAWKLISTVPATQLSFDVVKASTQGWTSFRISAVYNDGTIAHGKVFGLPGQFN
jgi:hypothetical protein